MTPLLTDSPFELFFDCVGLVLIVLLARDVPDDLQALIAHLRAR